MINKLFRIFSSKSLKNEEFSAASNRISVLREGIHSLKMERDEITEEIYAAEAEISVLSEKIKRHFDNIKGGNQEGKRYVGKELL